jgi:beta-phosphoglucomutase-like phosphatase (HAD superfamily)
VGDSQPEGHSVQTTARQERQLGARLVLATASVNGEAVLSAARLDGLFDAVVTGADAVQLGLPGKPAPDTLLEAVRRVGVQPRDALVLEDSVVGIEAGRRGGFGLVIGIDRIGHEDALRRAGADMVVRDLSELTVRR